ncbi:MAG: methyltransferase domain-containing protein [Bacteroidales bacterium]
MKFLIDLIASKIYKKNPGHGKKILANIEAMDSEIKENSELFLRKVLLVLNKLNKNIDFAVDSYLKMVNDMLKEQFIFLKTNKYSNQSFADVNQKVYNNPQVMQYHMIGLLISQFIWKQHLDTFIFFSKGLKKIKDDKIINFLEIGGGHGLYLSEAIKLFPDSRFDLIDISSSSIEIAKSFIENNNVNYLCGDIFEFRRFQFYNFITLGEVLEHVEDPKRLIKHIHILLYKQGLLFISVPINSPAIDHIFLFKNENEIKELFKDLFAIIEDKIIITENVDIEIARKNRIPIMYTAFLKKI